MKAYTSLEKYRPYLYRITFDALPEETGIDISSASGCSSYVRGGKLYRNLDWDYSDINEFKVLCRGFTGMAFHPSLRGEDLDEDILNQLPYHLVDGVNDSGIMVSTHVLYNDWSWVGTGDIPLSRLPSLILQRVRSMITIADDLGDVLGNLYTPQTLSEMGYLSQYMVTDGKTTFAILPPESSSGAFVLVDISSNPKMANFRWVKSKTVTRSELQTRPTGVERWNMMPCPLSELRFTKAYENPDRLSEFIGLRNTTKESTDEELMDIYESARALYLERTRDGETWQTMHSVIYSADRMEELYVQEDYTTNWGGATMPDLSKNVNYDAWRFSSIPNSDGSMEGDHSLILEKEEVKKHKDTEGIAHETLSGRSDPNQHPVSAISGLQGTLTGLQGQIDTIVSKSDVVDVVASYAALMAYDTTDLLDNDVVKVLDDEEHSNMRSYYRWTLGETSEENAWVYIGSESVGYTKTQADALLAEKMDIPDVVTTGDTLTLADNTVYRLSAVNTLTLTYPSGDFSCVLYIQTASSGAVTITFPTSMYIGPVPTFDNGEFWEVSIRNGVVVAGKAEAAS